MTITKSLSDKLFLSEKQFSTYAATVPFRYKRYNIKKRNSNDLRLIAQPSKAVKVLQRYVIELLKKSLPVHDCALAYENDRGIKQNAQLHCNNPYLLKMDFKDFFPSITPGLFFHIASKHGLTFNESDIFTISHILFFKRRRDSILKLSIGAPSSPFISNAVMYFFDVEVNNKCSEMGITYTRYADDITFSTQKKDILKDIPKMIRITLKQQSNNNIRINNKKTVFSSKAFNRHITGITINNNGKLSLGRDRKRLISSMIHKYKIKKLSEFDAKKLQGILGFAKHIEPSFIDSMIKKYGPELVQEIQKYNSI